MIAQFFEFVVGLIGEAGVGKTAITYGLAQRIVQNKVPALLKDYTIYTVYINTICFLDFEINIHNACVIVFVWNNINIYKCISMICNNVS